MDDGCALQSARFFLGTDTTSGAMFAVMVQSSERLDTTHVVAGTSWLEHPNWCKIKGSEVSASKDQKRSSSYIQTQLLHNVVQEDNTGKF